MELEIKKENVEVFPEPMKKSRGRPKKVVDVPVVKNPKGRPKTAVPLDVRRKMYDIRFSLRKLNTSDEDIDKVIEYVNKLNAERVGREADNEDFTHPRGGINYEKKDN